MLLYDTLGGIFYTFIFVNIICQTRSVIVRKPGCKNKDFQCPDDCTITWTAGCPESCDCTPAETVCPDIKCPAPPPTCIVYTRNNGCQSCACEAPFRVIEKPVKKILRTTTSASTLQSQSQSTSTTTTSRITTARTPPVLIATPFIPVTVGTPATQKAHLIFSPSVSPRSSTSTTSVATQPQTTTSPTTFTVAQVRVEPSRPFISPLVNKLPTGTKREEGICDETMQKAVDTWFGPLVNDIRSRTSSSLIGLPETFSYSSVDLTSKCQDYKSALGSLSAETRRNCAFTYEPYTAAYGVFSYACGYGSVGYFMRYFNCYSEMRNDPTFASCNANLNEVVNGADGGTVCNRYNTLLGCMYESVVRKCGYDAYEIEFQFLSTYVRRFSNSCKLTRATFPVQSNGNGPIRQS